MTTGEDVEVKFGASIEGLTAGVNRVKEQIEGLRAPVENFLSSLSGVGEAIGAAFVVEKLAEFVEKFGEVAEKAENTAAAIGVTAAQMINLQESFQLVGANADGVARTVRTMEMAIARIAAASTKWLPISSQASSYCTVGFSRACSSRSSRWCGCSTGPKRQAACVR
jgi:methyl-accepting chemotaxis protein